MHPRIACMQMIARPQVITAPPTDSTARPVGASQAAPGTTPTPPPTAGVTSVRRTAGLQQSQQRAPPPAALTLASSGASQQQQQQQQQLADSAAQPMVTAAELARLFQQEDAEWRGASVVYNKGARIMLQSRKQSSPHQWSTAPTFAAVQACYSGRSCAHVHTA